MGGASSISRSDASVDIKNAISIPNGSGNSRNSASGNSEAGTNELNLVIKKIMDNPFYEPLHHNEEAKMKFAHCLSDPKRLQETYLNPNWTITLEMVRLCIV